MLRVKFQCQKFTIENLVDFQGRIAANNFYLSHPLTSLKTSKKSVGGESIGYIYSGNIWIFYQLIKNRKRTV